ncbi:hypothetical protein JCM10049v2_004537 [Rhodotorula toruloides]
MLSEVLGVLPWLAKIVFLHSDTSPLPASASFAPSSPIRSRTQSPPPADDSHAPRELHSEVDQCPVPPYELLPIPGASCHFPLPRPSYVRLAGEVLQESMGDTVWKIRYAGTSMVVKGGPGITKSEAEMTVFVRAKTTIPVPQVYGVVREGVATYIYLEYIEGEALHWAAPKLGSDGLSTISAQLRRMLDELHSLVAPEGAAMGSLDGSNLFAFRCREDNAKVRQLGATASTSALIDNYLRPRYLCKQGNTPEGWATIDAHLDRSAPLVFIHGDIHAANILISEKEGKPEIIAIIDWECAGFYPEWVEYKAPARRAESGKSLTATTVMMAANLLRRHDGLTILEIFAAIDKMGMVAAGNTCQVASLNEFRRMLGLKEYTDFTDWNPDKDIAETACRLYKHVDNLELYPVLMAEQPKPSQEGSGLAPGYTISHAILSDAAALVRGDRFGAGFIAPYHDAPYADIRPPPTCAVTAAAFLMRHSSIYANDDEFDDYMEPFIERVKKAQKKGVSIPSNSPLAFLAHWKSLINDDNLEKITPPGKEDAEEFGKRFRKLYGKLLPPADLGKEKKSKDKKGKKGHKKPPFKVWSASSSRDIETSKAWVRGAFPSWQEGHEGEGDGDVVQLVRVDNKNASWADSLTPHKICDRFTKETGKPKAQEWLEVYGPPALERLNGFAPGFDFQLEDVIAMQMMCGYETVISKSRSSPFCSTELFTPDEFRSFGYWNDLLYHYMVGYGTDVSPYLGAQWLNVSAHNLLSAYGPPHPHPNVSTTGAKLPAPELPPDATHTQLLFPYFTHREEPPVALVALGLWNTSTEELPTDRMPKDRIWKTSHLLPFLGHVAIERLSCDAQDELAASPRSWTSRFADAFHLSRGDEDKPLKEEFIRVLVNGAPQQIECNDGPGGTCKMDDFAKFVARRMELFGDFKGACKKEDE